MSPLHPTRRPIRLYGNIDVETDPYELRNLADDPRLATVKSELRQTLGKWMKQQGDFLKFGGDAPVIITKRHPLDQTTEYQKIPAELEGSLKKGPNPMSCSSIPGHPEIRADHFRDSSRSWRCGAIPENSPRKAHE